MAKLIELRDHVDNDSYFRLIKPLHIAEVLTMREILVLGEHANCCAESTGLTRFVICFKGIHVTFVAHNLKLMYCKNFMVIVLILRFQYDEF